MFSLAFLGIASFALSLILTPWVRNVFCHYGILDHPDSTRKLHVKPIPRVGGIAIAISYVASFVLLLTTNLAGGGIVWSALPFALRIVPAAGLIFLLGLLDDVIGLKPWQKLFGQTAAAIVACWAGIRIHGFYHHELNFWLSILLTVVWLVACTNAMNLIDGVDGLAAGIGLVATATSLLAGLLQNNVALAYSTVPLVGCLLAFLRFNFNPATIFLGDCGSLFIGFLLGCFGVLWSQKAVTILGMTAPLMALAIPLLDIVLAILRRFVHHRPILSGDRGHIHHRLLDRGLTPRGVSIIIYAICGASGALSLALSNQAFAGVIIIVFCAGVCVGIQRLGYKEFGVVGRLLINGAFRRFLHQQIMVRAVEQELENAETFDECWRVLRNCYRQFGFHHIRLRLEGHKWIDYAEGDDLPSWDVRIPLGDAGFIELRRAYGAMDKDTIAMRFIYVLQKAFEGKLIKLQHDSLRPIAMYETALVGD